MHKQPSPASLAAAVRAGAPVAGLLYGLGAVHDDEGRPLGERRAPSAAKAQVPMVLEPCPYDDERRGAPMNVSALEQIRRHLKPVLDDVAAFRAAALGGAPPSWESMFLCVVDQLSGPLRHVLGEVAGPPPARLAVGHKLAAGFYDVVRRLLAAQARGEDRPAEVEAFLDYVHGARALVGASEVCGGPPRLIAWATDVFLRGVGETKAAVDEQRLAVSRALADQLCLGVTAELADAAAEAALLEVLCSPAAQPKNDFIRREVADRRAALSSPAAARPVGEAAAGDVRAAAQAAAQHPLRDQLAGLLALGEGAFRLSDGACAEVVELCAAWLARRCAFLAATAPREARLRDTLRLPPSPPVQPHPAVLPHPHAQRWIEAALGHTLALGPPHQPQVTLHNFRRTVLGAQG